MVVDNLTTAQAELLSQNMNTMNRRGEAFRQGIG